MLRKSLLFLLAFTSAALGLSTVSKRKSYTEGQVFTATDYNADRDETVVWINALNAKFPGTSPNDSTKTTIGAFDTLLSTGGVIRIKSYLLGVAPDDSLVFDNARLDTVHGDTIKYARAHLDTVEIDSLSVVEIYVSGKATFGSSSTQTRLNPDSLYIGGTAIVGFTLGASAGERAMLSYADVDTLVGVDTANVTAIRATRLHLSAAPVSAAFSDFASAGVRTRRAYADIDTLRGVDTLNAAAGRLTRLHLSAAPVGVAFSDFASAGVRMRRALADIDTIRTDSLTVAGPTMFLPGVTVTISGIADLDTARIDSATLGTTTVTGLNVAGRPVVGFAVAASAGQRTRLAYASTDTLSSDSLTTGGPANFAGEVDILTASNFKLAGTAYTGSMANLNTLTDDSMGDALHRHSELSASDGTPNAPLSVGAGGDVTLSDGYKFITGRAHPDSLYIGGTAVVGFALAQTAGTKTFVASLKTDSTATDSLTVTGPANFTGEVDVLTASNFKLAGTAYTGSMANLNTATDGSNADALHEHSTLDASDGTPANVVSLSASGAVTFSNGFTAGGDVKLDGDLDFTGPQEISTTSGDLTLNPSGITTTTKGLTVTGGARLAEVEQIEMRPDSSRVRLIDTTLAVSASDLRLAFLTSPVDVWFPGSPDSYARYRQLEQGTSLWRTDNVRTPAAMLIRTSKQRDSLSVIDVSNWSTAYLFKRASSNLIGNGYIGQTAFLDGRLWVATGAVSAAADRGVRDVDLLGDVATLWSSSGQTQYNGRISARNSASGYRTLTTTPAALAQSHGRLAVVRGGWDWLTDGLGRRRHYWEAGTADGSSRAIYSGTGSLSIYDDIDNRRPVGVDYDQGSGAVAMATSGQVGTGWTNGVTDAFETLTTSGTDILSGSNTTGNGAASVNGFTAITSGNVYRSRMHYRQSTTGTVTFIISDDSEGATPYKSWTLCTAACEIDTVLVWTADVTDASASAVVRTTTATTTFSLTNFSLSTAGDDIRLWRTGQKATADALGADETWSSSGTGSEDIPDDLTLTGVALLPGQSSAGENSPRIVAGADSAGLLILDAKASDNTAGARRRITNTYVSPSYHAGTVAVFAGASTANIVNPTTPFTSSATFAYNAASPTGAWTTSNAPNLVVTHTDLDAGSPPWTTTVWFRKTAELGGTERLFVMSNGAPSDANDRIRFNLNGIGDVLDMTISNNYAGCLDQVSTSFEIDDSVLRRADLTYDGSSLIGYINGRRIGTDSSIGCGPTTSNTARVGANATSVNIAGFVFTRRVLTAEEIQRDFLDDLTYINSPTPDTLRTGGVVSGVVRDRYSNSVFGLWGPTVFERRLPSGALIDTLRCTTCGALKAGDLAYFPGMDSSAVVFGGNAGTRAIMPDIRAIDLGQHVSTWRGKTHDVPVVVDSTGAGDFWAVQDAHDAASNVGVSEIRIRRGTYTEVVTISTAGMTVEGAGDSLTVINGGTTGNAITVSGADVTIRNLGAKTTPGGGTAFDPFVISGARVRGEFLRAMGSDDDCFVSSNKGAVFSHLTLHRCDDDGLYLPGGSADNGVYSLVRVQDQSGNAIEILSGADNNIIVPARTDGAPADAGANNTIIHTETAF